jgi:hypothetical protein
MLIVLFYLMGLLLHYPTIGFTYLDTGILRISSTMDRDYFSISVKHNAQENVTLCYQLAKKIDLCLINRLMKLGKVEINSGEGWDIKSNDIFTMFTMGGLELNGIVDGPALYVNIDRENDLKMQERLEGEIIGWILLDGDRYIPPYRETS